MTGAEVNYLPMLAAAADVDSSLMAKLLFQLTGFIIVLTVLTMLWGSISLMGLIFNRLNLQDPIEPQAPPAANPVAPGASKAALAPHHVAAITAALHTVIKGPYRIVDIKEVTEKKS